MDYYVWKLVVFWVSGRINWFCLRRALRERPLLVIGRRRVYMAGNG